MRTTETMATTSARANARENATENAGENRRTQAEERARTEGRGESETKSPASGGGARQETIIVTRRGADRVRAGHLWIYKSDVRDPAGAESGAIVRVRDDRNQFVGQAMWSDRSEISLRLLTRGGEDVDCEWWRARLRQASRLREGTIAGADAYRLVFSEGDLLPSLIVDRYRDVLVVQTLAQGTEKLKEMLVELLRAEFGAEFALRSIVERNDMRVRVLEGLPLTSGVLWGEDPGEFEINQHGARFRVAPLSGQKTGAFLDQRLNHVRAGELARGRALDCFTFGGGFAINLARNCEHVTALDISAEAVRAGEENARLNDLTNVEFREANVFDFLREKEFAGERYDCIVLDPPAFAKNRAAREAAERGYKEINLRAMKLLNPEGGTLITCTCSYHITEDAFGEIVHAAARDGRRRAQIIERRTQAPDHPVLAGVPETFYLKCIVARIVA